MKKDILFKWLRFSWVIWSKASSKTRTDAVTGLFCVTFYLLLFFSPFLNGSYLEASGNGPPSPRRKSARGEYRRFSQPKHLVPTAKVLGRGKKSLFKFNSI